MCVVSDKIKFCTCVDNNVDVNELNHYWILYRYNKNKELMIIGETKLPACMLSEISLDNQYKILKRLSNEDAFDKPIFFKSKDRLDVVFNSQSDERLEFQFEYSIGTWNISDDPNDQFHLMNQFDELHTGEIKDVD